MNQLICVVLRNIKLYDVAVSLNLIIIARAEIKAVGVNLYVRIVFTVFISKVYWYWKSFKMS